MENTWNVIFAIDNSGSAFGAEIASYNNAIREIVETIKKNDEIGTYYNCDISAFSFSDKVNRLIDSQNIFDFNWDDIQASGASDYSFCFQEMDGILKELLEKESDIISPLIILISDGCPTSPDYKKWLKTLSNNKLFQSSSKIVCFNSHLSKKSRLFLSEFTANIDLIMNYEQTIQFIKKFKPNKLKKDNDQKDSLDSFGDEIW